MSKKSILSDNALEAWSISIYYCNAILDGKATLQYKKMFVSSLHNATELFIKQLMLNNNDYRVATPYRNDEHGNPARKYYSATNLNEYFHNLSSEDLKKYRSIEFNKIIEYHKKLLERYLKNEKNISTCTNELKLLQRLRNDETHFYINKSDFLDESEFIKLHNFMVDFYNILQYYGLLPFFGEACCEYEPLGFEKEKIDNSFSYKTAVTKSKFVCDFLKKLPIKIDPFLSYDSAYTIAESIVCEHLEYEKSLNELRIYLEMMMEYDLIKIDIKYDITHYPDGYQDCEEEIIIKISNDNSNI